MKKLLWIGDAVIQTGFARVTHNVIGHLIKSGGWDVHLLGVNYRGDPHPYPYKIYPAVLGGDIFGVGRVDTLCRGLRPDAVFIINDPWLVRQYLDEIPPDIPVIAYMPVDSPNQRSAKNLQRLTRAIAYTAFGRKELVLGGYGGPCDVIPHGVDTELYRPIPKGEAIAYLKLTEKIGEDSFIVGCVNRNQPRKRLDLTIQYWTQWWINAGQPNNAYLYIHASNRDIGWHITQLAEYYGIDRRLIITNPNMTPEHCLAEQHMPYVYGCFDVHLSTTMGEGWGLTQHESMACGVPNIVPEWSALAEWPKDAVRYVPCTSFAVTPQGINTIGGVPDMQATVDAIDELYRSPEKRLALSQAALARATEDRFQWPGIARQFHAAILETVLERRAPAGITTPAVEEQQTS